MDGDYQDLLVKLTKVLSELEYLKAADDRQNKRIDELIQTLKNDYVSLSRYAPIEKVVVALLTAFGLAVLAALTRLLGLTP